MVCRQVFKRGVSDIYRLVSSLGGTRGEKKKVMQINIVVLINQRPPAQITVHGGGAFPLAACNAGQARRPGCSPTAP